ncbi:hypothetical protein [Oricola indica]|uniref:hypothetical protein n=1 Tax=Oricola indica TaxID=2872591 RepID=UPI003CCB95C0
MTRRVKLMADYDCWPLWGMDGDDIGNLDPAGLGLSSGLVARLAHWSEAYDARLDRTDPAGSPQTSPEDTSRFEREGLELWRLVREELGSGYEVHYFSDLEQRLMSPDRSG